MNIVKGQVGQALTSVAQNHVIATTDDIYDINKLDYQQNINHNLENNIKTKANITDLSNVIGEEVITNPALSDINELTREQIKKDLFNDLYNKLFIATTNPSLSFGQYSVVEDCYYGNTVRLNYKEALDVVVAGRIEHDDIKGRYQRTNIKTNIPPITSWANIKLQKTFLMCMNLEIANVYNTSIGNNCFYNNPKLTKILGPFIIIEDSAFSQCPRLKYIELLLDDRSLTTIKLPLPELNLNCFKYILEHTNLKVIDVTLMLPSKIMDKFATDPEWTPLVEQFANKRVTLAELN